MTVRRVAWTMAGFVSMGTSIAAGLTIWLLLTEPVRVGSAVSRHDLTPILHALADVVTGALTALIRYL